jgi:hypothetical protein
VTTIRQKTLRKFGEGAVTLRTVVTIPGEQRALTVDAKVDGHRGRHSVSYSIAAGWRCSCAHPGDGLAPCPHIAAVQMVTGHPSAAEKPTRTGATDG